MDKEYYKRYEPFFGEWYIKKYIGAGSYGKVFEIERRDYNMVLSGALKAISVPVDQEEYENVMSNGMDEQGASKYFREYVQIISREIEVMSKLRGHTNIVGYEDHKIIPHANGIGADILIRMELLTPITNYLKANNGISRQNVIRLGIDMCRALEVCKQYNIIHRDIKPANIFVSDSGSFKLGDFGVARVASATTGASTRAGTMNYMAPEVFHGQKYNSSVDIYSLGLVMYQLLNANRMPFTPPYPKEMSYQDAEQARVKRLAGAIMSPPAYASGKLAKIILHACAPDPDKRYNDPAQMRRELEAVLNTEYKNKGNGGTIIPPMSPTPDTGDDGETRPFRVAGGSGSGSGTPPMPPIPNPAPKKKSHAAAIAVAAAGIVVCVIGGTIYAQLSADPHASTYRQAVSAMQGGDYSTAAGLFEGLGSYKDSADQLLEAQYQMALASYRDGDYVNAYSLFYDLSDVDYKDSTEQFIETAYCIAVDFLNAEYYTDAVEYFTALEGYKDSTERKLEAMGQYVQAVDADDFDRETAYTYLQTLLENDADTWQPVYDALFSWKAVDIYWSTDEEGENKVQTAKAGDTVYFHFTVSGGEPGASVQLYEKSTWSDGYKTDASAFEKPHTDGNSSWVSWQLPNNFSGSLTEIICDANGSELASGTLSITK